MTVKQARRSDGRYTARPWIDRLRLEGIKFNDTYTVHYRQRGGWTRAEAADRCAVRIILLITRHEYAVSLCHIGSALRRTWACVCVHTESSSRYCNNK